MFILCRIFGDFAIRLLLRTLPAFLFQDAWCKVVPRLAESSTLLIGKNS